MEVADDLRPDVLHVSTHREGVRGAVDLSGELDLHTAEGLKTAVSDLLAQRVTSVGLDASGLGFADSAGLQAMLEAREAVERAGATFAVTHVSGPVLRVIEIAGLSEQLSPRT